jgi:hypothetical protein
LQQQIDKKSDLKPFSPRPELNPMFQNHWCHLRVPGQEIEDPLMQKIRYMISWWMKWPMEKMEKFWGSKQRY